MNKALSKNPTTMTTMTCRRPSPAGGHQELHDARRLRAAARRTRAPDERGAALGGAGGVLGGVQWRPFRERRLSLRQETSARDRPPHALPDQAPDIAEVVDPAIQPNRDQVFSAPPCCTRTRPARTTPSPSSGWMRPSRWPARSAGSRPCARADQGQGRRHRSAAHAGRHRGTGYPGSTVSAGLMRILASKRGCKSGIADHCKNAVTGAARSRLCRSAAAPP